MDNGWSEEQAARQRTLPGSWSRAAYGLDKNAKKIEGSLTWQERAAAYDSYMAAQAFTKEEDLWRDRGRKVREHEFEMGEKLVARAERMLQAILFERETEEVITSPDGKTAIVKHVYKPTDWNERDIANTLKVGSDLLRRATNLSDRKVEVNWREELARQAPQVDPEALLEQMVNKFLEHLSNDPGSPDE